MHSRSYSREIDRNDHTSYNNQDNQNYPGEENHTGTPDSILETDTTIDQIPYDILSAENIQAIDNSTPFIFELTQALLEKLHEGFAIFGINITGLPWWAAIFCSAIVLRGSATLPISIFQQRAIARTKKLEPVLKSWSNALKSFAQIEAKSRRLNDAEFKKLFYKMYGATAGSDSIMDSSLLNYKRNDRKLFIIDAWWCIRGSHANYTSRAFDRRDIMVRKSPTY
ncbi:Mitochondrial inner membrane protein COX18 [Zancudomyces culisetae]|uniref:Mitochondrial inner membrane protein COX18 n=1 Tax=Zancudomyces culisetae TaxID=1213189 RepID=A0A1R1PKX9_ZANCU|nr:Mitochondrial inner membrane protein COX18 [Zancudomyces culisetae]|eukprot:OMH81597.1 Mitochondrial inner membrane protein COX18 [Zancudomyces culisetae]